MPETPDPLEEFPRQAARTRGFSLGVPRAFTVSPDGERVVYLRTKTGDDPVSCLWVFDVSGAKERLVFDPGAEEAERDLTDAERVRRERARERSSGVTSYATDDAVRRAVFTVGGRMFLADLVEGSARELSAPGPVDDPRLDPGGRAHRVRGRGCPVRPRHRGRRARAGLARRARHVLGVWPSSSRPRRCTGSAATGGRRTARSSRPQHVDERDVLVWHISDPTDPAAEPRAVRYPQAGTSNAVVTLWVFDVASGERVEVAWDHEAFPYLSRVHWGEGAPLLLLVQTRDQRTVRLLEADAATGGTSLVVERSDPQWIDLPEEAPVRLSDGRVVDVVADRDADTYRLTVAGESVTAPGLQVRAVLSAGDGVLFRASDGDPTEIHLWRWTPEGGAVRLSEEPGVHSGAEGGEALVRTSATVHSARSIATVMRSGEVVGEIENVSEVLRGRAATAVPHARRARAARGAVAAGRARARWAAPRAHGSVWRTPLGSGAEGRRSAPDVAVVRGQRVRGARRRRARGRRARSGVGPGGLPRLHGDARGPGGRAPRRRRAVRVPRPRTGRDPRVVVRRRAGGDGVAPAAGRVPRGRGRRAGDRPAPVRHLLYGAVPGAAGPRSPRPTGGAHRCSTRPRCRGRCC